MGLLNKLLFTAGAGALAFGLAKEVQKQNSFSAPEAMARDSCAIAAKAFQDLAVNAGVAPVVAQKGVTCQAFNTPAGRYYATRINVEGLGYGQKQLEAFANQVHVQSQAPYHNPVGHDAWNNPETLAFYRAGEAHATVDNIRDPRNPNRVIGFEFRAGAPSSANQTYLESAQNVRAANQRVEAVAQHITPRVTARPLNFRPPH